MIKFFKAIGNFFVGIYNLLDKYIIIPISRLIYRINELIRNNSGKLERILNRTNVLIYVSLFFVI